MHCDTSSDNLEAPFDLLTCNYQKQIFLHANKIFQFSFKQNLIAINGYSIESGDDRFPTGWKLEYSVDPQKWDIIDIKLNVEELKEPKKIIWIQLEKQFLCSHLRLTFLSSTSEYGGVWLTSFDIFGKIIDHNSILQNLVPIQNEVRISPPIVFEFKKANQFGFFKYIESFSIKIRSEIFSLRSTYSEKNSSVQNLIHWDEENWKAKNNSSVSFEVEFKLPWVFKPFGYRLKSGNENFFNSWEFRGLKINHHESKYDETVLDKHFNNFSLSSPFAEKSFAVSLEEFFNGFYFQMKNQNIEANKEEIRFCLSGFEIFGILQRN
jgi:hypothetical protein